MLRSRTPRRRATRRRADRGGAAVELILSIPLFLMIFVVMIVNFSRVAAEQSKTFRAARQVAWSAGRHADDDGEDDAPAKYEVRDVHFGGLGKTPTIDATTDTDWSYWSSIALAGHPASGLDDTSWESSWFVSSLMEIGRGFPKFVIGQVGRTKGTVTRPTAGYWVFGGTDLVANSYVVMRTARESDPGDPEGWFDPFKELKDWLSPHD